MDKLRPFEADFLYYNGCPVATLEDSKALIEIKIAALEMLHDKLSLPQTRLAPFVQVLSMARVELPAFFIELIGWDYESAFCMSQLILDRATEHLTGWPISYLEQALPGVFPINHQILIFSTPALNMLSNMLTNPLEDIAALVQDGVMDQLTKIQTVEAAYLEVFREVAPQFTYPVYANTGLRDLIEPQMVAFLEDLEK